MTIEKELQEKRTQEGKRILRRLDELPKEQREIYIEAYADALEYSHRLITDEKVRAFAIKYMP
jgi:DNA-directed RNA polymerase specialized sigma24 family protein